jgi:lysophospholipase L1-like esterase
MNIRFKPTMLFLAGMVCAAAAMEAGLKLIAATPMWRVLPVIEPILGKPDRDTGYVFTPGVSGIWTRENRATVDITDLGLRGPVGITQEKSPGTRRIALFGDSVTEGLQVEYEATFGAVLEKHLNRENRGVEVINFAMSGNGPLRQLVRLEQRGYSFDPDIIVSVASAFDFLTGELRDDRLNPGYIADGHGGWTRGYAFRNRFSVREADSAVGRLFVATLQRLNTVRMIYLRSREPVTKLFGIQTAPRPTSALKIVEDACHVAALAKLHQLWIGRKPEADWTVLNHFFDELVSSSAGRPVRQVYAMRDIPIPPASCVRQVAERAELIAAITAALVARGIEFVDLESRLVADSGASDSRDLESLRGFGLQLGQGHLNQEGHRRYAAALQAVIEPLLPR